LLVKIMYPIPGTEIGPLMAIFWVFFTVLFYVLSRLA
jgi:hypothetical protein